MPANKEQAAALEPFELNDDLVRNYLKTHDDFLQRNPDLLDYLHVDHQSGSAVSLVEKQVSVLRERNMDMRHRLNTLTGNARENDRLYEQSRVLILQLLEANSIDALYAVFTRGMLEAFNVDHACMILYGDSDTQGNYRVESLEQTQGEIGPLIRSHKAVAGTLRKEELAFLFPGGSEVGSAALMPLCRDDQQLGLIAVGSSDANRYNSGVGTMFLSHIADVIVRLLPRLQPAGE